MEKYGFKIPVFEYEKGWGNKLDDWMVCIDHEQAEDFKKTFNEENNLDTVPDWYMISKGEPELIQLSNEQFDHLVNNGRQWLSSLKKI